MCIMRNNNTVLCTFLTNRKVVAWEEMSVHVGWLKMQDRKMEDQEWSKGGKYRAGKRGTKCPGCIFRPAFSRPAFSSPTNSGAAHSSPAFHPPPCTGDAVKNALCTMCSRLNCRISMFNCVASIRYVSSTDLYNTEITIYMYQYFI